MNALPWWLTWFDGRALLLLMLTIGAWTYYCLNDDDESSIALDESLDEYDER
jgi:hypothetical protein